MCEFSWRLSRTLTKVSIFISTKPGELRVCTFWLPILCQTTSISTLALYKQKIHNLAQLSKALIIDSERLTDVDARGGEFGDCLNHVRIRLLRPSSLIIEAEIINYKMKHLQKEKNCTHHVNLLWWVW
jgi:hypothetical protein